MSAPDGEHDSPLSPSSPAESPAESDPTFPSSPPSTSGILATDFASPGSPTDALRLPSIRSTSDSMTASSSPLGNVAAARRPVPKSSALPADMQAKMKAFQLSRQRAPPGQNQNTQQPASAGAAPPGGVFGGPLASPSIGGIQSPGGFRIPPNMRPHPSGANSAPVVPSMKPMGGGLAAKRGLKAGLKLSDATKPPPGTPQNEEEKKEEKEGSAFSKYSSIVDTSSGTLNFEGKATIHGSGIDFSNGSSFTISLDDVETIEELGKGNYGTVYQVRHTRPRVRKAGLGLAGNKAPKSISSPTTSEHQEVGVVGARNTTGIVMAMKEIRLELDDAKFAQIIMELDILHRCTSPFIVDFYGAFFQEGAVYICIEFMDGGSIDKIHGDGIPENVLKKITLSTVLGLKDLKETHNIIHRDVKPTNILVNSRGQVKICDFGVSGNLVASIAKTNIGCQSYMAPERISSGGVSQPGNAGGTYSVQSDIWSLGLTIIECAMGRYPYPPETYNNIFSQLSAIVDGEPPDLPDEGYSEQARAFVKACLRKDANLRPDYKSLVRHPWLAPLFKPPTISEDAEAEAEAEASAKDTSGPSGMDFAPDETADEEVADWVKAQMAKKKAGTLKNANKPALHAAPLDTKPLTSPGGTEVTAGGA